MSAALPCRTGARGDGVAAAGEDERALPEETPVAIVFDGATHAVLLATPEDLEDFALGFAFTEGVITHPGQVRSLDVARHDNGVELRLWLESGRSGAYRARRRVMVGPTGCGLCGVDSLAAATPDLPTLAAARAPLASRGELLAALDLKQDRQRLRQRTGAVHAAAFWRPGDEWVALREDVGRHNALDKLAGALLRAGVDPGGGAILMSSRVSVELVQKAVRIGAPVMAARGTPTTLAVATARRHGLALLGRARAGRIEIYSHPERISPADGVSGAAAHVL